MSKTSILSMAPKHHLIEDIVAGKIDWKVKVRVSNIWCFTNKNNPSEKQQIEMLLIDQKGSKILATVPKAWVRRFDPILKEGETYLLEDFTVSQQEVKWRRTAHKFKILFMGTTKLTVVPGFEIPINSFEFWDFEAISKEKRNEIFVDIIGHVVQKDNLTKKDVNGRETQLLELILEDLQKNMIKCTLWEEFALRMQNYLDSQATSVPVVVLLHQGKLANFQGTNGVASGYYGTKLYINQTLPEIIKYRLRMTEVDAECSQTVTQMAITQPPVSLADDLLQTPHMTIADLLSAKEPCFGTVMATVVELNMDQGWTYNSCNSCLKFVKLLDNKFTCGHCKLPVSTSPRYKLNMQVIDDTGSTTFTMFNTLVSAYVGRSAEDLLRVNQSRPDNGDLPVEFLSLVKKKFLFKVQVTFQNINLAWQSYTVKKWTSETSLIEEFLAKNKLLGSIPEEEDIIFDDTAVPLTEIHPVLAICGGDSKGKSVKLMDEFNNASNSDHETQNADIGLDDIGDDDSGEDEAQSPVSVMPHKAHNMQNPVFLTDDDIGDSLNSFQTDSQETPPTQTPAKRSVTEIDGFDLNSLDFSPESPAKIPKILPKDSQEN